MSEGFETGGDEVAFAIRSNAANWMTSLPDAARRMGVPLSQRHTHIIRDYAEWKKKRHLSDFTDMLVKAQYINGPDVKVVMVDEAQDLSELQFKLIRQWSQGKDLYLAGDDDQSIYGFIGASEYGFLEFQADTEIVLTKSHRCPPTIGRKADEIISRVPKRKQKNVDWADHQGKILRGANFWGLNIVHEKDVMVLCRHRSQCKDVFDKLIDMKIPCSIYGQSFFQGNKAECIRGFLEMRQGAQLPGPRVAQIFKEMGNKTLAKEVRDRTRKFRGRPYGRDDFDAVNWDDDWAEQFGRNNFEKHQLARLRRVVNARGHEILGEKPAINIMTYHASKGREADTVILMTDCYQKTWDQQQRDETQELRLCYVGITRAKKQAVIILPSEPDRYMKGLVR